MRPHLLLHPGRPELRRLVRSGELGDIQFVDSVRINLGLVQRDIDVLWDLAPHDLSILRLRAAARPVRGGGRGARRRPDRAGVACVAYLTLQLSTGAIAHVHVNWLSPIKVRTMIIGGSKRTLVWDDLNPTQRLSVYDRGVDRMAAQELGADDRQQMLISYRAGDMVAPALRGAGGAADDGGGVRGGDHRGPAAGHRRPGRAAGLEHPGGGGRSEPAQLDGGRPCRVESDCAVIAGQRAPGHRRRRHHRLAHGRPAGRRRRRRDRSCSTTSSAAAGRTWPRRMATGRVARRRGRHPRHRRWCARLTAGNDLVFHLAAIRITQCAEEPRLALEVLVDGTFNVLEAAVDGRRRARSSPRRRPRSTAWPSEFPTTEAHHPYNNDTFYGAAKVFNEGMLRSFHAMYGLDYVALRYFNVYGPRMDIHGLYTEVLIRWMERIAAGQPPLILGDGLQTMDFVHVTDIARANILAAEAPTSPTRCSTSRSGAETSLRELAEALLRVDGQPTCAGVRPGPRGQRRHPPAGRHSTRRENGSGSTARDRPRRGAAAASSTGGAPSRCSAGAVT